MSSRSPSDKLDEVERLMQWFKNPTLARCAVAILNRALMNAETWPDEVDLSFVGPDDKNCIGICWRSLRQAGLLVELPGLSRRSRAEKANGRRIFCYGVSSRALATTLVRRLGGTAQDPQQNLPL